MNDSSATAKLPNYQATIRNDNLACLVLQYRNLLLQLHILFSANIICSNV